MIQSIHFSIHGYYFVILTLSDAAGDSLSLSLVISSRLMSKFHHSWADLILTPTINTRRVRKNPHRHLHHGVYGTIP